MHGWNLAMILGGLMQKQLKTEWQSCSESEIDMFERFFEDGYTELKLMGVPERLTEAYQDYYNWRITCDDGAVEILDDY